jgi:hypothetical protein
VELAAGANMRTLLAIVIFAGAMLALDSPADAARKSKRSYQQPKKVDVVCEERAQQADRTGLYAAYPCWAREAFARRGGGRGGR